MKIVLRFSIFVTSVISIFFLYLPYPTQAQTPAWTQLSPNPDPVYGLPTTRVLHSAVYDVTNNKMTIFGGTPEDNVTYLNDVWVLSTANGLGGTSAWKQLNPHPDSDYGYPPIRGSHTAVYDTANNQMIIFGGYNGNGNFLNDTWVLSTANGLGGTSAWKQLNPHPDKTYGYPSIRRNHTAVYDTTNNRMIIFGGYNGTLTNDVWYLNDVWVLNNANGQGGTPTWTQLFPTGSTPATRCYHSAVYDNTNNQMIIFGGDNNGTYLNDVWVLSNANGLEGTPVWTQITTTGSTPIARLEHTAVYGAANNRMTIFGGSTTSQNGFPVPTNDVWVLSTANGLGGTSAWTQITTTGSTPTARLEHTAVYDATNNRMTIFGGVNFTLGEPYYFNDVWVLSTANGISTTPSAGFYAVPTSGFVPLQVQFTDTSANNPTSWIWSFGDGGTSTTENPSYSYTSAGAFTVQLIVSNAYGTSTATLSNYIYTISTVELPPILSNPPSLKAFIGVGLTTVFNLEDYNSGGLGNSYSLPTDFLSLGTTSGSYESQAIYNAATTGTNTYQISNDVGTSSASGLVKYSTYGIRKLPHVGLTPGSSWDVNLENYTYDTSGIALPLSFGNPTALYISDLSSVTAYWVNNSVIRITSLQSFSGAVDVDVTASPNATAPFGSDVDVERIQVYPNLLANSTFSTSNDTSTWMPEIPLGKSTLAAQQWTSSYIDAAGTQAKGIWKFTFTDASSGVKATPVISDWINITNGQWYTFRIRLVADIPNNSHQAFLYGFTNYPESGTQTDIVGNGFFGVPTVWTWQEAPLLAHGSGTTGYPQFQFKAGGAGSIYVDEIQIINAAPALMQARSNTHSHYLYGQFTTGTDTTGWGQELYPGAGSAPEISVDHGLVLNFAGAGVGTTAQEGIKWTANNGVQGPLHAYSFPDNVGHQVGAQLTLSIVSGNFNTLGIVLVAAYGAQTAGDQDIDNLIAAAGVGALVSGNYYAIGEALYPYSQGQFGVRSDAPGVLEINNADVNVDNDDPNFGDATLFP